MLRLGVGLCLERFGEGGGGCDNFFSFIGCLRMGGTGHISKPRASESH